MKTTRKVVLLLAFFASYAFAFKGDFITQKGGDFLEESVPWTLTAEKIEYLKDEEIYIAEGAVTLQSGNRIIKADKAIFEKSTALIKLEGNALVQYGEDWIKGDLIVWNIEKQTGYVEQGKAYFHRNNFFVSAKKIEKLKEDFYRLEDGFVTACDPSLPDWSVHYKSFVVPVGGMARGKGVVFRIGSVPVIFLPWVVLPVQTERQSGLLTPTFGYSELNGVIFEIPYYWAIDRSKDATFFGQVLQKRGFLGGIEYRWNTLEWGEGILLAHYLNDLASEDHRRAYGFSSGSENRYWIRGRASGDFQSNISARLNLDILSDEDFLREFKRGSPSYEYTNKAFMSFLGSGILGDDTLTARESSLYAFKRLENLEFFVDFRYWDENDPFFKDLTIQKLPSMGVFLSSSQIGSLPIYYRFDSLFESYWHNDGFLGTKVNLIPSLAFSKTLFGFINSETNLKLVTSLYSLEDYEKESLEGINGRSVPSFSTGLNLELERDYDFGVHRISPEIKYEYVSKMKEDVIPSFDLPSSPFYTNRFRYGFNSSFSLDKNGSFYEIARVDLFQYYRLDEQRVSFFEEGFENNLVFESGFSDVYVDLNLSPSYVSLGYNMAISSKDGSVSQQDIKLSFNPSNNYSLGVSYRQRDIADINEIITTLNWNVKPWLSLGFYHDYRLSDKDMVKQTYTVTYRRECWFLTLSYEREGEENRFFVSVNLMGLGHADIKSD